MADRKWRLSQRFLYTMIHLVSDLLVWLNEKLMTFACARDLWRTPEARGYETLHKKEADKRE